MQKRGKQRKVSHRFT